MEDKMKPDFGIKSIDLEYYFKNWDKCNGDVLQFRKAVATTQSISEDYELDGIIDNDMYTIWSEVGGQDGMYESFPITRVYRDNGAIRVYALDGNGGVAIIHTPKYAFQVLTLGEDDGSHFLRSRRLYEEYIGDKADFVYLLSEALSLFNNIKL